MSENLKTRWPWATRGITLDVWAVLLALALVALVRLGWLPGIGW